MTRVRARMGETSVPILSEAAVYIASSRNGRLTHWTGYIDDRRSMRVVWHAGPPTVYGPQSEWPTVCTAEAFAWDNAAGKRLVAAIRGYLTGERERRRSLSKLEGTRVLPENFFPPKKPVLNNPRPGAAQAAGEKEKAPPPSIALERKQAKLLHQNKNRYQTTPGWGRHLRLGEKGPPKKVKFRQAIFGTAL